MEDANFVGDAPGDPLPAKEEGTALALPAATAAGEEKEPKAAAATIETDEQREATAAAAAIVTAPDILEEATAITAPATLAVTATAATVPAAGIVANTDTGGGKDHHRHAPPGIDAIGSADAVDDIDVIENIDDVDDVVDVVEDVDDVDDVNIDVVNVVDAVGGIDAVGDKAKASDGADGGRVATKEAMVVGSLQSVSVSPADVLLEPAGVEGVEKVEGGREGGEEGRGESLLLSLVPPGSDGAGGGSPLGGGILEPSVQPDG